MNGMYPYVRSVNHIYQTMQRVTDNFVIENRT